VRFYQYGRFFESIGLSMQYRPLLSDKYLKELYAGNFKISEVVKGYLLRLVLLSSAHRFDVVVVEKELFPFLPPLFEFLLKLRRIPFVVDYDDAIFHQYDLNKNPLIRLLFRRKIDAVMRMSSHVIAGNQYLADRSKKAGAHHTTVIPTVVDTDRYVPKEKPGSSSLTVGWIGTPKTSQYLKPLVKVFERIMNAIPVRFIAIGAKQADFIGTPIDCLQWSEASEVGYIQSFDIGIMPLSNSPWEKGKCGYKLVQYMACGIPVVASPVGVNCELVRPGFNGFLANENDWEDILIRLLKDRDLRQSLGAQGRYDVETSYSIKSQQARLLSIIRKVIG
jgi:glycosyltransferase involved in cell wall biosynthesis